MDSRNTDPATFTNKIFKLTGPQLVECVEAYLQASLRYGEKDKRSLYIFFGTASLAVRKADAFYAFKFEKGINTQGSILARRFEALDDTKQKKPLLKDIKIKKKQARVLDDLKMAYYQKEKKDPTLHGLREFEPVTNPKQFSVLSKLLDRCNRAFNQYNADDFSSAFDGLSALVLEKKDLLLFLALLRRCREAKEVGATLRRQMYWYMVGALYLQALRARPEVYRTGFSNEEKSFLFDTEDLKDPYFPDFAIRLDYLWLHDAGDAQFTQTTGAYAQLLLFAGKIGARLVPIVETAVVEGVVGKLRKEKPREIDKVRIPINSRYDRDKTLRISQTVGHIYIVWWEQSLGAYIRHQGFDGILFRVDSYDWLGKVYDNDAIWGEVYRSTAHLLVLIPFLFELLGYLPDLVTGGITGLAKAIFTNLLIDKAVEKLGLNSNVVQLALLGAGLLAHHVLSEKGGAAPESGGGTLEGERGVAGKWAEDNGAMNRSIDPQPSSSGAGPELGGSHGRMADRDMRGIGMQGGNVIGEHEPLPFDTLTEVSDHPIDSGIAAGKDEALGGSKPKTDLPSNVPPATRQDLAIAEGRLNDVKERFRAAADSIKKTEERVGDLEYIIETSGEKGNTAKLKENLAKAEQAVEDARARYKKSKYELRAAQSKVDRLTKDLASRGELQPTLRIEWNLPDKPTMFRYKGVEEKSWRPDAWVGVSDDRKPVERILNEEPDGELGKRLLNNGKLYPAAGGDKHYWKAHPESIELAHVWSKRERGSAGYRDVYIVMTKSRNQAFSANLERTGGVFKDDAIVIQGMAIDKISAIELGVPQSVIDRAPVITFAK